MSSGSEQETASVAKPGNKSNETGSVTQPTDSVTQPTNGRKFSPLAHLTKSSARFIGYGISPDSSLTQVHVRIAGAHFTSLSMLAGFDR